MNKLPLLLLLILFIGFFTNAQGIDLQLNQVIYIDAYDMLYDYNTSSYPVHIVPEGKIWKITSCSTNSYSAYGDNCYFMIVNPDGEQTANYVARAISTQNTNTFESSNHHFPIWLPEGYGLSYGNMVNGFSILEFNAVSQ